MDEKTQAAITTLADAALADRLLVTVLAAWVMRQSPDAVAAAAWLTNAAVAAAKVDAPQVIPDLRQVLRQAMDLAEARPGTPAP
jgi:hypothetical protein